MGAGYFFNSAINSSVLKVERVERVERDDGLFFPAACTVDSKNIDTTKFIETAPHTGRYENSTHGNAPKNNKNKMPPIIIQTPKKMGSPRRVGWLVGGAVSRATPAH